MTQAILWEIHRSPERGGFVERLVRVDAGVQYERLAPEQDQGVYPDLRPKPFPDLATALKSLPELLDLSLDDEVLICALADDVIVEHLVIADDGYAEEFTLAGRSWSWRGFPIPLDVDPIDSWSTGDDYGWPGGDRTSLLYRFGTLSLVDQLDRGINILGRHETAAEAQTAWVEGYIPGGWESYAASPDFEEDDEDEEE